MNTAVVVRRLRRFEIAELARKAIYDKRKGCMESIEVGRSYRVVKIGGLTLRNVRSTLKHEAGSTPDP